jgi:hypothetical protein
MRNQIHTGDRELRIIGILGSSHPFSNGVWGRVRAPERYRNRTGSASGLGLFGEQIAHDFQEITGWVGQVQQGEDSKEHDATGEAPV